MVPDPCCESGLARMKVRRYFAPDMRTALAAARREQGGDVIILGQRRVEGGLELITADEYDEALLAAFTPRKSGSTTTAPAETAKSVAQAYSIAEPPATRKATERAPGAKPVAKVGTERPRPATKEPATTRPGNAVQGDTLWTREPVMEQMHNELRSLRGLLQQQFATLAWNDLRQRHPLWAYLLRRAVSVGVSPRLARELVQHVAGSLSFDQGWEKFLALFAQRLRVTGDDLLTEGGAAVLVGPTGVGKTTLVCKLAAQFALRHGNRAVALITADSQRIAAHQQLRSFGRIMNIPVRSVSGVDELLPALDSVYDRKLILVDTAGMSHRDDRLDVTLAALRDCTPLVKTYVVASTATQGRDLEGIFERYRAASPVATMLTKLDETSYLGPALSAVILHELPVAYASGGQRIPEDCEAAVADRLVRRALIVAGADKHVEKSEVDLMMEELFSGGGKVHAQA